MPRAAAARSAIGRSAVARAGVDRTRWGMGPTPTPKGIFLAGANSTRQDYLVRPYAAALHPTAACTVFGWSRLMNTSPNGGTFFHQGSISLDNRWSLALQGGNPTGIAMQVWTGPVTVRTALSPINTVPASGRFPWSMWFDGAGGTDLQKANCDVNGALDVLSSWSAGLLTTLRTGTAVYARGIPTAFGAMIGDTGASNRTLSGVMDGLAMWSSKLSAADRAALHAGADPRTVSPSTLVGYWPCDEETGGQVFDASGSNPLRAVTELPSEPRYVGQRYSVRQEIGPTRRLLSYTQRTGVTKLLCGIDSLTEGTGYREPAETPDVGGYRTQLINWLNHFGRAVVMVGPQSTGPAFMLNKAHDGIAGRAAETYAALIAARITTYDPDILFIEGGTNDIFTLGRTIVQARDSMMLCIRNATNTKPTLKVLWMDMTPSKTLSERATIDAYNEQLNAAIAVLVGEGRNVTRSYAGSRGAFTGFFDNFHPACGEADKMAYQAAREIEPHCAAA